MRLQAVVVAVLIGLAGCGGGDDQLDREQLVPKGMRRTTVTTRDATTEVKTQTAPPALDPPPAHGTTVTPPPPALDAAVAEPPAQTEAPAAGAFVVQAGAFRQSTTAEGLVAKLLELGIVARVETAQVGGGTFHRVVVPGLADRVAADALTARLKQELGIDAVVRTP
jgi:cell division protein FtsN